MKQAIGTLLLCLTAATALLPQGHCLASVLATSDTCCCAENDCGNGIEAVSAGCKGGNSNCLLHPKACCHQLSTSMQQGSALTSVVYIAPSVAPALEIELPANSGALPAIVHAAPAASAGPPLFIRHASILI